MKYSLKYILSIILLISAVISYSADIKGFVDNIDHNSKKLNIISSNKTYSLTVNSSKSKLFRSLVNTQVLEVDLLSVSPGDSVECSFDNDNVITNATFTFNMIKGTIEKINGREIILTDGQKVKIAEKASISLKNGNSGKVNDLVPGNIFVARSNPDTGDIWTLVVSGSTTINNLPKKIEPAKKDKDDVINNKVTQKEDTKKTEKINKPIVPPPSNISYEINIESVQVSASENFASGDLILVKVCGTSHCGVAADIQYVKDTKVTLEESDPGVYSGFIKVPSQNLNKAKIIAYMSKGTTNISKTCDTILSVSNKKGYLNNLIVEEVIETPKETTENLSNVPEINDNNDVINDTNKTINDNNETEINNQNTSENNTENIIEKKESEQIQDNKDNIDLNTNKDSIAESIKSESNTIKLDEIKIISPVQNSLVNDITISGLAIPNSNISIKTLYTNDKYGVLSINGILDERIVTVNNEGIFNYGPIKLENFLATSGLIFYIEIKYADHENSPVKVIKLIKE